MSRYRTPEEVKQQHIDMMGVGLGSLYHELYNELAWLNAKWGEYIKLYGTKRSRIDLINRAAGYFFGIVQDSLFEDVLLHITRLTDRKNSVGKENLTIKRLPDFIDEDTLKKEVSKLIDVAEKKTEFCRDWRNRRIAHKDLGLALNDEGVKPLKPASRAKVKESIKSMSDVLNEISKHYLGAQINFEVAGVSRDAVSLLYIIDDGLRAETERKEAGKYPAEGIITRDL